jgi:hypothetical protein
MGVAVSVIVGVWDGAIVLVGGTLVKALSGNDSWPDGTQLERINIKVMKISCKSDLDFMFGMIPWIEMVDSSPISLVLLLRLC